LKVEKKEGKEKKKDSTFSIVGKKKEKIEEKKEKREKKRDAIFLYEGKNEKR